MFKNYLLISWRNLIRNKAFSTINLLGLAVGMTCTLLIILWVQDELNYDKFQDHYSTIHRVMAHRSFDNQTGTDYSMPFPLAEAVENEIAQVEQAVVSSHTSAVNLRYRDQVYHLEGLTTSPHFLEIFSVTFIQGGENNPMTNPNAIILTESSSNAIFGDQNPLNQTVTITDLGDFKVVGIVADLPTNSSIQFDYLTSFNYNSDYIKQNQQEWSTSSWIVYVKVIPGADMVEIDKQINQIKHLHDPEDREISNYFTFPMAKWRLYSDFSQGVNTGGLIQYVRLFTVIALIILIIACVNFMNLSTARSERRAKEVGIRKTLGSLKYQLIYQFFMESLILALLAFLLALLAVKLLLPSFNQLVNKELMLDLTSPQLVLAAIIIIALTGVLAGSYPALFLSSFNTVKVLKSTVTIGKGSVRPRQMLMIFQFVISILLISATVIVYQQINMVKNRDLGYSPDNLITIPGSRDTQMSFDVIKQELLNTGRVASLTRTMSPITNIWWHLPAPNWQGKAGNTQIIFSALTTGADFTKTMGIKMLAGQDFSGTPADSSYVLLNQAAVTAMGVEDPIGLPIQIYGDYTVLGVTENVVQESPFHPVKPMIVFYKPTSSRYITVRLKQGANHNKHCPQ